MNFIKKAISWVRRASFYKRLILSYIAGQLIVLLIIALVCVNLIDTISTYSDKSAVNATQQFQATVENMVEAIQKLPTELSFDQTVISLMTSQKPEFDARQRYNIVSLSMQLKNYNLLNTNISDIFLYFPAQDYLISGQGVYTLSQWQSINLQNSNLENILTENTNISWEILKGTGRLSNKTVMCSKLVSENSDLDAQPSLCVFLSPILKSFSGAQGTDELSGFYTVNSDGNILFQGGALNVPYNALDYNLMLQPEDSGSKGVVKLQKGYIGYALPSNTYNFSHVYFSPESEFFSTLITSKRVVVFSCLFILVLGVVISVIFAHRTSRPIRRIANIIESGEGQNASLEYIEKSVINLVQIQKKASKDTEQYKKLQQESILLKLLHKEIANEAMLKEMMEQNGVSISGDSFLVATARSVAEFPLTAVFSQFCSVCTQQLSNTAQLYFFRGTGEIKIVAAGEKSNISLTYIKDGFQKVIQQLETDCHIRLLVAISEIHSSLFGLGLAYEETQRVNDYSNFVGVNLVLTHSELLLAQKGNENSLIFTVWFNKFANTLMNQDFEAARNIQRNIFTELSKHEYSLQFVKCKIFSFIDRTIDVIGEMDISYTTQLWDDLKLTDRLLACTALTELEEVYSEIFAQLTQIVAQTDRKETRVERIISIIQSSYTQADFSVSSVADQLSSSAAYVSRIFKDETGSNMLDYIQKLRIDLAKKLLLEDCNMTVAQICEQCGFSNNITFTRVFKNYEGVPPGKYRSRSAYNSEK